jgi:hypothetical protein
MSPVPPEAFQGLTGRLVSLGLVHAVWVGLLASAVAAIVFQALPRISHRVRYGLLAMAMGTVVAGPIVAVVIQRSTAESRSLTGGASIRVMTNRVSEEPAPAVSASGQPPTGKPRMSIEGSLWFTRLLPALSHRLEAIQPFVLASWLIGVAVLSARLILGAISLRRLVRAATPAGESRRARISPCYTLVGPTLLSDNWEGRGLTPSALLDPIQTRADGLARRLKLRRMPLVLVHSGPIEPGLCGLFRPKILLPGPWLTGADAGRIDAILAHELAHARRLDLSANLLQRLVETAFFFHPAVHWLSRALRRERELCADALAVALTGDPVSLASALESVARFRLTSLSSGRPAPLFGASLGGENLSLLPRIQELLGMTPNTSARRPLWPWVSLPSAGLLALFGASLGLAQDPPKAVAPSNVPAAESPATAKPPLPVSSAKGEAAPRQSPSVDSYPQVSFEVRFLSAAGSVWRDATKDRLHEVYRDDEVTSWIVRDQKSIHDLVTALQGDPRSNLVQFPKVTTYEGAQAMLLDSAPSSRVDIAGDVTVTIEEGKLPRPSTKSGAEIMGVGLTPTIRPGSVQMTIDLYPSLDGKAAMDRLLNGKTAVQPETPGGERTSGPRNEHYLLTHNVPDGSGLLIRVGSEGVKGDARQSSGLERMVLITPKAYPKGTGPEMVGAQKALPQPSKSAALQSPVKPIEIHGALNGRIIQGRRP